MKVSKKQVLFLIVVLALAVRLPNINANLAGDEIDIAGPARHYVTVGDFREFNNCSGEPQYLYTHPPVRMLLYSAWASIFGFSNMALRALPIIFGLASVVVVYLLGREVYSEKVGLIAAFLAAVSRYSIYGSTLVSTDTGNFIFTTSAAVLFFVMHVKRKNKKYLAASLVFSVISMLTKFSTLIIFVPIMVGYYLYGKRKTAIAYPLITLAASIFLMVSVSLIFNDSRMFTQPLEGFLTYSTGTLHPTLGEYVMDKIFKLATITWQLTPFFAVLLLLSLASFYKSKKTKDFWILASWLVVGFLIVAYPYGQDAQRFFLMLLTPAFLLTAKYMENINLRSYWTFIVVAAVAGLAFGLGLNDLMGYYQPAYLVLFYLLALAALLYKKKTIAILVSGFIGMSLFFAFSSGGIIQIQSAAVGELTQKVTDYGYPYKELWTSKDVAYYVSPKNGTVVACELTSIDAQFLKDNKIGYMAFYSTVPRQTGTILGNCSEKYTLLLEGYDTGFVCKTNLGSL